MFGPNDEVDDDREELVDNPEDGEASCGDRTAARHAEEGDGESEGAGEEDREPHPEGEPVEGRV